MYKNTRPLFGSGDYYLNYPSGGDGPLKAETETQALATAQGRSERTEYDLKYGHRNRRVEVQDPDKNVIAVFVDGNRIK